MAENDENSGTVNGRELLAFIERLERLRDEKKEVADQEKEVLAEAKGRGFATKYIKALIKLRTLPPDRRSEDAAMLDLYASAIGMQTDGPLFAGVSRMGADPASSDAILEALKTLAPIGGDFTLRIGRRRWRVWRDGDGNAHAEERDAGPGGDAPTEGDRDLPFPEGEAPADDLSGVSDDEAEDLGRKAAAAGEPIVSNPFAFDDKRRGRWDLGWRNETGGDGMGPDEGEGDA